MENNFHDIFLTEFVALKVSATNKLDLVKYCRVNQSDNHQYNEINSEQMLKSQNNPFASKIVKAPEVVLIEHLSLMYEEVRPP